MLPRLLVFLFLCAVAGLANAEPRSASNLLLHTLLTNENPNFVLMGAKAVERDPAADKFTLDLVAELLDQRTKAHVATGLDLDTTAWFMKALGASKNARYRPVIERAISTYANEKISTFGNLSLAQLILTSESSFSAGSISVDDLRQELQSERAALAMADRDISVIKPADTLDSVFAVIGYPDALLETVDSRGFGGWKFKVRSLQLQYYGLGLVDIDNRFGSGQGWTVSVVWPDIPTKAAPYSGPNPGDARLIMTTDPMLLRKLAKRLVSKRVTETELLDRAAERIQVLANRKDEFEVDAIALLMRLLAASGNKKYIEALGSVAARSEDSGLAYRAKLAREQLEAL